MRRDPVWDYRPSSDVPLAEWLVQMEVRHGLVPADAPLPTVDELGLSVLRFHMVPAGRVAVDERPGRSGRAILDGTARGGDGAQQGYAS